MADFNFGDLLSSIWSAISAAPSEIGQFMQTFVPPAPLPTPTAPGTPMSPATANVNAVLAANPATANLGATNPPSIAPPAPPVSQVAPTGQPTPTWRQDIGLFVESLISSIIKNPQQAANMFQALQRYQLQQKLLDPKYIASQVAKLDAGVSGPLRQRIMNQTQANLAAQGLGQAPTIMREATQEALAPYEYASRQQALQEYLQSIGIAENAYPLGGPLGEFSNFLSKVELGQAADGAPAATGFGP